jgi:hypothetical protein
MIELKISNGKYLTHEDLEKYLNEYEKFLKDSFQKNKMMEYEWEEFIKTQNDLIEKKISQIDKIELIIEDISKTSFSGWGLGRIPIKLRGKEILGDWNDYEFSQRLDDIYNLSFKEIVIKNPLKPPFSEFTQNGHKHSVPYVNFTKLTTEKPNGLKKGNRIIFHFDILIGYRLMDREKYQYINLKYYEKVNILPPAKSNSNCFIVTTTMGDINHPVVIDFRNYRDEVLLNTILGRLFIKIYYKIGPSLSEIIKKNDTLFQISRSFILKLHKRIFKK